MSIPEANRVLPESTRILDAFQLPKRRHFTIGDTLEEITHAPIERVALAASDYFTSGLAFLANRGHDPYMRYVGSSAWMAIDFGRVTTALSRNMREDALKRGMPRELAATINNESDDPAILFTNISPGRKKHEQHSVILLPPEFIILAQHAPVEALAKLAMISSQINDYDRDRLQIDPGFIRIRAAATGAHYLFEAQKKHPDIDVSKKSRELLSEFPDGIYSYNVPIAARYWSTPEMN